MGNQKWGKELHWIVMNHSSGSYSSPACICRTKPLILAACIPSKESLTHILFKKLGCHLIYFPGHSYRYWEWFNIDSTCNVLACFFVNNSSGQTTQLSSVSVRCHPKTHCKSLCLQHQLGWKLRSLPGSQRQVCYGEMGGQTGRCFEHLQHLSDNMRYEIFSKTLLGRQDRDCTSMSGPLCSHSSSVCLSTGISVSLPPPPSWLKRCPIARTNKQTKNPTLVCFQTHLYGHPFLKSNL